MKIRYNVLGKLGAMNFPNHKKVDYYIKHSIVDCHAKVNYENRVVSLPDIKMHF